MAPVPKPTVAHFIKAIGAEQETHRLVLYCVTLRDLINRCNRFLYCGHWFEQNVTVACTVRVEKFPKDAAGLSSCVTLRSA